VWIALLGLVSFPALALGQPPTLERHAAVYDPVRQRMIVFGGYTGSTLANDTWQLTLGRSPQWSLLAANGPLPSGRFGHAAVYDPVRDRLLVIGGFDGGSFLSDVWSLPLSGPAQWSPLSPSDPPPSGRRYHSAIYDPVRDRVVIYGGGTFGGIPASDTWSLWLSPTPRWEQIFPVGDPPVARFNHSAVFDRARDCMLVYGGGPAANTDLAELSLGTTPAWTALPQPSDPRLRRQGHTSVFDAARDRMVLFGGNEGNQHFNDTWALSRGGAPSWTPLTAAGPPSARSFHTAVLDSAYQRMIVFGGFPNVTEGTWGLSLAQPDAWSPFRPMVTVAPQALQLPTVTVGDTVSVPFVVKNGGLLPLQVDSLVSAVPGTSLSTLAPFTLDWNEAQSENLLLAANTPRSGVDSLVIRSNDPAAPRMTLPLVANVLPLQFEARVLGEPDSVPLGTAFIVVASPAAGVHVEKATLYYSISRLNSFSSLELLQLGTDFLGSVPAFAVTEYGVDYYVRVENSGFGATQPATAPETLYTQRVARPTSFEAVPRPDFPAGRAIEVEVQLPQGSVFESGSIHYRRGGETLYETALLTRDALGRLIGVVPDTMVTPRGVEYWMEAQTLGSSLTFASATIPAVVRILVEDLVEKIEHPAMRYRLLSIPLDLDGGRLVDMLSDQLGTYDPVRWRSFWYDPAAASNVELPSAPLQFEAEPGRAFWLISREPHRVDTSPLEGGSTSTAAAYMIPLAAGWNLFGNPFDFPVAWSSVGRDDAIVEAPFAFVPGLGSVGDYADEPPAVLQPFEGYFVYATEATILTVPPRAASASIAGVSRQATAREEGAWRCRMTARTDRAQDGVNEFGIGGTSGALPLRSPKPPSPPGPWVRVALVSEGASGPREHRRDLRPAGSPGETWEIEIRSSESGELVTVEIARPPEGSAPAMRLVDRETGEILGATGEEVTFRHRILSLGSRPYRLAVVAGSEEYVAAVLESRVLPDRATLDPAAPNPFRGATRVRFGLPTAERVTLEVFSVLGQRIGTPIDRVAYPAGFHAIVWDGRSDRGEIAPAGVYLLRLTAGPAGVVRRLVRLP
jgi:hypothetical protein